MQLQGEENCANLKKTFSGNCFILNKNEVYSYPVQYDCLNYIHNENYFSQMNISFGITLLSLNPILFCLSSIFLKVSLLNHMFT